MRVKLIVTGKLEKAALHRSLGRWFPQTGAGEPVEFMPPSMFQGPTCNRLDDGERLSELVRTFTTARRHPKRYLAELLRRSGRPVVRPYRETHDGARAIESLAWPELSESPETLAFARALFEDLADALAVPNPLGDGALAPATHPRDRRDLVLRNL